MKNPTLDALVAEGGDVLGRETGLWSTEAKVWGMVPKAAWHWGGDGSVANDFFGAPGSTRRYVCLSPEWEALRVVTYYFPYGSNMTTRNYRRNW
jgi:hypothetical protein